MKKINNENFRLSPSIADIESPEFGAGNRGAFPYYSADELPPVNKKKRKKIVRILRSEDHPLPITCNLLP